MGIVEMMDDLHPTSGDTAVIRNRWPVAPTLVIETMRPFSPLSSSFPRLGD